jgi:hypothetical protein
MREQVTVMTTVEKTQATPPPVGFGRALVDVGGRFMIGAQLAAEAEPFGMESGVLYLRGRTGVLGTLTPAAAAAVLGTFPPRLVEAVWRSSAGHRTEDLVAAYARAAAGWGQAHLAGSAGADRMSDLIEPVVDTADPSALPLFAGWRAAPRPSDPPARAAHLLMVLRELRGGLHFAALRARGLDVPTAALTDPGGGRMRLRRLGWRDPDLDALRIRCDAVPDTAQRWSAAESATGKAFSLCLAVLAPDAQAELASLVEAAESRSRPAEAPIQPGKA